MFNNTDGNVSCNVAVKLEAVITDDEFHCRLPDELDNTPEFNTNEPVSTSKLPNSLPTTVIPILNCEGYNDSNSI